ncbi:cell envelope integrity protein CreD [Compostibacter hankyongensis]|uniref:Cell envelope integrity protein CreD n=1 Tax=Compostibacter hankyongensis TaxID=1007089 RepID=A0ABP8FF09_9BACT
MENSLVSFWERNRLVIKICTIGILALLLLIPTAFISSLVREREARRQEAVKEVSNKWASGQTVSAPVLVIPYLKHVYDEKGQRELVRELAYFLPDQLHIDGKIIPEKRYRGIYEVILYRSDLHISGRFDDLQPEGMKIAREDLLTDEAFLMLGLDDVRGLEDQVMLRWADTSLLFRPGLPENTSLKSGISVPVSVVGSGQDKNSFAFDIRLKVKGSGQLFFVPLGATTTLSLRSPWPTPSFDGSFLPDKRRVTPQGFEAEWKVFHLNRNFPQHWTDASYKLQDAAFGVNLMLPVDAYQQTMRCVKYAILFIALTFIVFFLLEATRGGGRVHPFQYLLIGLALCVFYTLLLSISEYLRFSWAYGIAAVAVVGLIALYSWWVFRSRRFTLLVSGILALLYGFIFTLVQLEDFSLLAGSVGLFSILTLLMYYSRKIDWYGLQGGNKRQ